MSAERDLPVPQPIREGLAFRIFSVLLDILSRSARDSLVTAVTPIQRSGSGSHTRGLVLRHRQIGQVRIGSGQQISKHPAREIRRRHTITGVPMASRHTTRPVIGSSSACGRAAHQTPRPRHA